MIYVGSIPTDAVVMHSCDNRKCVNPRHLSIGTNAENAHQAWERDRFHGVRKLGPNDIRTIRSGAFKDGPLAESLGVTERHVADIRRGRVRSGRCRLGDGILRMEQGA